MHDEVAVVAPQVVEDHRYGCSLRTQSQLEVARVVGGIPVLASNMAVVSQRIAIQSLVADVAVCGIGVVVSGFLASCALALGLPIPP